MASLEAEDARVIDKFNELQSLEVQIGDGIGFRGPLRHCGQIQGSFTFQH